MKNCYTCAFADFDPKTGKRTPIYVDDMYAQIAIGEELPKIRIVGSCGKGKPVSKTQDEHKCSRWFSLDTALAEETEAEKLEVSDFTLETSRLKLPPTNNALVHIEWMAEEHAEAFDVIMDVYVVFPETLGEFLENCNDMNMRGYQIVSASQFYDNDITALCAGVAARSEELVDYVNSLPIDPALGRAVTKHAAKYGHKAPDDAVNTAN